MYFSVIAENYYKTIFPNSSSLYVSGEAMNLFLNDNWKNVANEVKPILEDTIANIFKKFANKIFHKYPLNVLLPP